MYRSVAELLLEQWIIIKLSPAFFVKLSPIYLLQYIWLPANLCLFSILCQSYEKNMTYDCSLHIQYWGWRPLCALYLFLVAFFLHSCKLRFRIPMKTLTAKNNRAVYKVGSILLYRLHLIYKVKNRFEYYITSLLKYFVLNFFWLRKWISNFQNCRRASE